MKSNGRVATGCTRPPPWAAWAGATTHGLAITPAPAKANGGLLDESAYLAKGENLAAGASGELTADL